MSFKTWETVVIGCSTKRKRETFFTRREEKGGVVNTVVAVATTKVLMFRMISDDDEDLKLIDIESTAWAKSLFKHMGFGKGAATTSKAEIPELAGREVKLLL